MLRSLYSGISGLRANQTMMDVVGNNIANVNTVGFKSSNAIFQDTLSQVLVASTSPSGQNGKPATPVTGGTNPAQVGLGVRVAAIQTNFGAGSTQTTGRSNDVMIQNDGFLIEKLQDQSTVYTRNGALNLDASGYLTGPDGGIVQGYPAAPDGTLSNNPATDPTVNLQIDMNKPLQGTEGTANPVRLTGFSIGKDGIITGAYQNGQTRALGQLALATFINPSGLSKVGQSGYVASINSGQPDVGVAATGARGSFASGFLEMSNVDLAQEFTSLIVAQRGFQANSRIITAGDEVLQDLINMKR